MKHLVLIGAPGAGKGTVAKQLDEYTQLSTGDMLRAEKAKGSELGKMVAELIDNGKFVGDELMFDILKENLPEDKALIFDGYPRNVSQIEYFEKLVPNEEDIIPIYFNIDLEILEDRIVNRSTCVDCGEIHNLKSNKPTADGKCNKCGGELNKRADDNAEALKKRLDTFVKDTFPMVDHFKKYKNYAEVTAEGTPEEVLARVRDVIDSMN